MGASVREVPTRACHSICLRLGLFILVALLSGCTIGRVNERMAYWSAEIRNLPAGTSLSDAQVFFKVRGMDLRCCVSGPPGAAEYYFATERKVGRVLFTEYDVAILVALDPLQRVGTVHVERWGVGL